MTGNMEKTDDNIEECLLPQDSEDVKLSLLELLRTGSLQRKRWYQRSRLSLINRRESRNELPSTAEAAH